MGIRLIALSALLLPAVAGAIPIQFAFTGTVTSATGIWAGQGTEVTGFYIYDPALFADSDPSASRDFFLTAVGEPSPGELSVTVGAVTRTTATNAAPRVLLELEDRGGINPVDSYAFEGLFGFSFSDNHGRIQLSDLTPSPPDAIAPGSNNLTGAVPLTAPDLALFDSATGFFTANVGDLDPDQVHFDITSITIIPEPSTAALLCLGLAGFAMKQRRLG